MKKRINITIEESVFNAAKKKYKNLSRALEHLIVEDLDTRQYSPKDVISHHHISVGYDV